MAGGEGAMEEVSPRRNGGERPRSEGGGGVDGIAAVYLRKRLRRW